MIRAATVCVLLATLGARAAAEPPRRIVSLVPSATEALFAMGAGPRLVGVGSFDSFPPDVATLPKVGALLDPDVERILSLKPDLMICYASQADLRTQLDRAGIRQFVYRHGSLADAVAGLRQLGVAIGSPRDGEALAARLEGEFAAVRSRVAGRARPRVMLVIGRDAQSLRTISVSGGYGFLHDLIGLAGGTNVFADVARESLSVSTETVLARAPEVILELRYSGRLSPAEAERERHVWDVLPGVPAVRAGRIRILTGGALVIPGPRMGQTADTFARAVHPDAR